MNRMLHINGQPKEFAADLWPGTLKELLEYLKIDQATVVAEIDGQIVERRHFDSTALAANQRVELIRFVGGG